MRESSIQVHFGEPDSIGEGKVEVIPVATYNERRGWDLCYVRWAVDIGSKHSAKGEECDLPAAIKTVGQILAIFNPEDFEIPETVDEIVRGLKRACLAQEDLGQYFLTEQQRPPGLS